MVGIGLVGILLAPHLGGQAQYLGGQAQYLGGQAPYTPYSCKIEVIPPDPSVGDNITIRLFGTWSNSCVPNDYSLLISGNNILISIFTPSGFCFPVFTPWSLDVPIGPLSAWTYQVAVSYPQAPGTAPGFICRDSFVVGFSFQRGPTQVEQIEEALKKGGFFADRLPAETHTLLKGIEFTSMGKMLSETRQTLALDQTLLAMAYAATPGRMPVSAMLVPARPPGPGKGYIGMLFLSGPSSFRHEGASIPPGLYLIKITKIGDTDPIYDGIYGELVRPGSSPIPIRGKLLAEDKAIWDLHIEMYDPGGCIGVNTPWGVIIICWGEGGELKR